MSAGKSGPPDVEASVIAIVSNAAAFSKEEFSARSLLVDDLNIDSIGMVDLRVAIEQHFNMQISDKEWSRVRTVRDLIDVIDSLIDTAISEET